MNRLSAFALLVLALHAAPAVAMDIDTCGTVVLDEGRLVADLVCDGDAGELYDDAALLLRNRATLDMNGHSLTVIGTGQGIRCDGKCVVTSSAVAPGEIVRGTGAGSSGLTGMRVSASNLVVRNGWAAAIYAWKRGDLQNVTCLENLVGFQGARLTAVDVSMLDGEHGIGAYKWVRARNLTVSNNSGWGIDAGNKMRGWNVTVTNNGRIGIDTAAGSPGTGGPIRLDDSTVTGNEIDLYTPRPPRLRNTSCDSSLDSRDDTTWGVCSAD